MNKVSVIVPVYNVEKYLNKCVDSIINQTYTNIEVILVDDGSKDESGRICDQYAKLYPRLINVVHQTNNGLGGARNTGIKAAHGKYIMFVDSDDYLNPDAIEIAHMSISQNDVDMVAFGMNLINEKGHLIRKEYDGKLFNKVLYPSVDHSLILNSPHAWNKIYKTTLFTKNNIWFPSNVWYEDIRTTLKIYTIVGSVIYIHETLYNYLQREDSIMHNPNIVRNREIIDALDDILDFYKNRKLAEVYYNELESLAILHVYIAASTRVAIMDPKNDLLLLFQRYLAEHFPRYSRNKYMLSSNIKRKALFFLLEKKQYRMVKVLSLFKKRLGWLGVN